MDLATFLQPPIGKHTRFEVLSEQEEVDKG